MESKAEQLELKEEVKDRCEDWRVQRLALNAVIALSFKSFYSAFDPVLPLPPPPTFNHRSPRSRPPYVAVLRVAYGVGFLDQNFPALGNGGSGIEGVGWIEFVMCSKGRAPKGCRRMRAMIKVEDLGNYYKVERLL